MASVVVSRSRPAGRVAVAAFMADVGCLGIKSALALPSLTEDQYGRVLDRFREEEMIECAPALAAKLVTGAYEYARSLGFKPDPDYFPAREIFGSIAEDHGDLTEEIEYGKDGKPLYVAGPNDDIETIMDHLTRTLGPDGFHYIVPAFTDDPDGNW